MSSASRGSTRAAEGRRACERTRVGARGKRGERTGISALARRADRPSSAGRADSRQVMGRHGRSVATGRRGRFLEVSRTPVIVRVLGPEGIGVSAGVPDTKNAQGCVFDPVDQAMVFNDDASNLPGDGRIQEPSPDSRMVAKSAGRDPNGGSESRSRFGTPLVEKRPGVLQVIDGGLGPTKGNPTRHPVPTRRASDRLPRAPRPHRGRWRGPPRARRRQGAGGLRPPRDPRRR